MNDAAGAPAEVEIQLHVEFVALLGLAHLDQHLEMLAKEVFGPSIGLPAIQVHQGIYLLVSGFSHGRSNKKCPIRETLHQANCPREERTNWLREATIARLHMANGASHGGGWRFLF